MIRNYWSDHSRVNLYGKMRRICFYQLFIPITLILILTTCKNDVVTLKSLLSEMTSREMITYFPGKEYKLFQSSSYNRASVRPGEPGWFANNDMSHFIRIENNQGRREFVMMDTDGPGSIVRWWMTFYKARNGIIRIYIDNDTVPVIKGAPTALLSGNVLAGHPLSASLQAGAPLGEEGRDYDHNLYIPIPFSKHCKVTYECDSLRVLYEYEGMKIDQGYLWPDVFYNICYRLYTPSVKVESFSMEALRKAEKTIEDTNIKLSDERFFPDSTVEYLEKLILPGDSVLLFKQLKNSAINRITIILSAANMPQALRSTVIKGEFDGISTVWSPVGEFFGTGYSLKAHQTWMTKRDEEGRMESFWIMPFRESAEIAFVNYGNDTVRIKCSVGTEPYRWTSNSMYFAAQWHEYYDIRTRDENNSPFDLNFINLTGKGIYAGDQITIFNNTYHWWGEGDEKIFVDGESFPSSFGTGSEDYYGYSFGREESFSHPFLCQPEGTGNMNKGLTVNTRLRSLDAIPFKESISSNIELWHWADISMDYALTTFFYVFPPLRTNIMPDIESVRRSVRF